jgi:Trypsin Inhibitor like cysteine rich domain
MDRKTTKLTTFLPFTVTKQCPVNQVWSQCGMNGCQACGVDPTVCKPGCPGPGCTCAQGYKVNSAGQCVLPSKCPGASTTANPQQCGKNEYWGPCGHNSCENCLVFLQQAACRPSCQPGCQCLDGYRRNDSGVCIPESQCQLATTAAPQGE